MAWVNNQWKKNKHLGYRGGSRIFSRVVLRIIAILFLKTIYTLQLFTLYFNQLSACTYVKYLLCMKPQSIHCCSCSYYTLMLLYICMIIYSLAWPDPISRRGTITCSSYRSAYNASDNASMRTRAWCHKTRLFMPLHYIMDTSIPSLLSCYQNLLRLSDISSH